MFPMRMFPPTPPPPHYARRARTSKMHPVGEECELSYSSAPPSTMSPMAAASAVSSVSRGPVVVVGPSGPLRKVRPVRVDFAELAGGGQASGSGRGLRRPGALSGPSLQQPRLSLLGKPINYKARHRDHRYRRAQAALHNLLERPRGWKALSYHLSL
ncbi:unnamed protein product [Ixodes pacificus]